MSSVFLIPNLLDESAAPTIPAYVLDHVKKCKVIFAEDERTVRRYLKKLDNKIVIDDFEWVTIAKDNKEHEKIFRQKLKEGKDLAIISEAGCPGIADPGQTLIAIAHEEGSQVVPLVGPISPMLALMASGMNGQHFEFVGYLPIDAAARTKALKELETESARKNSTKIFIETPYRNNQLVDAIIKSCSPHTQLCIASSITGPEEKIISKPISWWKEHIPELHKKPTIFLLFAGRQ